MKDSKIMLLLSLVQRDTVNGLCVRESMIMALLWYLWEGDRAEVRW